MGAGWRRWKERVRESMPGAQDLTSNARNRAMMKTATDFSSQVRRCEKAIRASSAANAELLSTTKGTMTLPLPQTYDETNNGAGSATAALNLVGGPQFKADAVGRVANETQHKLETEVLAPLTRWQDVHLQLAARFKDLENTRLELDSRRRTVIELSQRVSGMRAKLGSAGGHKPEAKLDATIRQLSHKEAKLKVTTQNFDQQEALLARDLAALIADGQYLKHYVAAALRLQGGALLGAADSFGELASAPVITAPAPVPTPTGTPTGTMTGAGAAGFGASAGSLAPAPPLSGRNTADGPNPYHSNNGPVTSSMSQSDRPASYGGGAPGSLGQTKRFSEPEAMEKPMGLPKSAVPVEQSTPPPSDNPYSVRNYSYA